MSFRRCVIVICDSLRADLVGDGTPVLQDLARHGVRFDAVRAVFPSTTRVSSACIATGCHPERHGLLGNTMILDEPSGLVARSAGAAGFRTQLHATTGRHLKVPTLAQRLADQYSAAIYSNVSAGAAYFFDPDGFGYVYHRAGSYGPGMRPLDGSEGLDVQPGADGDAEMTRRFCSRLQSDNALALAVLWLSEPDSSGHARALGSMEHRDAIGHAERCVAQVRNIVTRLREQGEDVLLMVGSDHGMESVVREIDIAERLVEAGLKESPESRDIVVAPNGTAAVLGYVDEYPHRERLLAWLAQQDWVGDLTAGVDLKQWGLPDEPGCRVGISLAASSTPNAHGVPGSACYAIDPANRKSYLGHGQHGGRNPHERHPFLVIDGGDFPEGETVAQPISLTDYAPTVLYHLGLPWDGTQGSPLQKLLLACRQRETNFEDSHESTRTC